MEERYAKRYKDTILTESGPLDVWIEEVWVEYEGKTHVVGVTCAKQDQTLHIMHLTYAVRKKNVNIVSDSNSLHCYWKNCKLSSEDELPRSNEMWPIVLMHPPSFFETVIVGILDLFG